jgi:hypothetical protein
MATPAVRYPAGEVTPHGWWHIINDTRPMMWLDAYDESIRFDLMGGLAPPYNDPASPEAVALRAIKGLIAPWQHIDQKGATEDGVTSIDALFDPIEVEAVFECIGRDPKHLRRVYRDLIASIDAIQKSKLSWMSHDTGLWWAPIRWYKGAPPDPLANPQTRRQRVTLRLRADHGFWESFDDVAQFGFTYDSMTATEFDEDLTGWPQYRYEGTGDGGPVGTGDGVAWNEVGTDAVSVVLGPYADFDTDTDNQVVETVLGSLPEITFVGGAFNDLFGRMGRDEDGDWDGNGVRARIGMEGIFGWAELTRFNDFVPTAMSSRVLFIPPLPGEKFSLVCGVDGDPRLFRILRNGIAVLSHKEIGTGSALGADFRGIGAGMGAGESVLFGQRKPAYIRKVSAGDNATVTQSGWLKCTNIGDQKLYYDYTLFGPGTFRIWDGPASGEHVEFGPLTANQIVYLRTDPRSKATLVKDLTVVPSTPQEQSVFQSAIDKFLSFAFANNVPPLLGALTNIFGVKAPQGNLYRFLDGRFSDNAAIPPKSPGNPVKSYQVKVEIVGGTADSKVIASGTPLRRYPL